MLDFLVERFPAISADEWSARMAGGNVVDRTGRRFFDEGGGLVHETWETSNLVRRADGHVLAVDGGGDVVADLLQTDEMIQTEIFGPTSTG